MFVAILQNKTHVDSKLYQHKTLFKSKIKTYISKAGKNISLFLYNISYTFYSCLKFNIVLVGQTIN